MTLKDKDTPIIAKIFAAITVGYALSPIDLIPDFIPILGCLDDLILLPVLVTLTLHFIPHEIFERCKLEAKGIWKNGRPKKWYYSIPILLIWLSIIIMIINIICFN